MTILLIFLWSAFCCPRRDKLWCIVYSSTFVSKLTLTFSATVAVDLNYMSQLLLHTSHHRALTTHDPVASLPLVLPSTIFHKYLPLQTRNTPKMKHLIRIAATNISHYDKIVCQDRKDETHAWLHVMCIWIHSQIGWFVSFIHELCTTAIKRMGYHNNVIV